jgi:hypothetical protein
MFDIRLWGTWRSDARRTLREVRARRDITARQARGLAPMFGRLELRFTKTLCYLTLNGNTESRAYKVLAKDSSSVATVVDNETPC